MRHLRDKLLVAFLPLILLLIGATYYVQRNVVDDLSNALKQRLARSYQVLEGINVALAKSLNRQLRQINESSTFKGILREYVKIKRELQAAEKSGNAKVKAEKRQQIDDYEQSIRLDVGQTEAGHAGLDLLAIVDMDGHLVASIRRQSRDEYGDRTAEDGKSPVASDPLIKTALDNAREGNGTVSKSFMLWADGKLYFAAASPLIIDDYVEGALIVATSDLTIASAGDAIFASNNRVLMAPAEMDEQARREFETEALAKWTPPIVSPPWVKSAAPYVPDVVPFNIGGKPYYGAPCPLWEVGRDKPVAWEFFIVPLEELLGPALAARVMVVKIGASILLLAIVAIVLLSRRITRPIETLRNKMREVGHGDLDQKAPVSGRDEVAQLSADFNKMVDGLREKEALARYVPEKARDAIADGKGRHALGAKRVKASILFSDLRGFTTLSEKIDPSQVVEMLNEYLEHMQRVISDNSGYISDYIGDAIVAVFTEDSYGTGVASSAHMAVQCALDMQNELAGLRASSSNPNLQSLRMGIGVNTGFIVEGDMGPKERLKYAVLGDTVNTAARIQDRSKEGKHTSILVSGVTFDEVRDRMDAVFFGDELLKGKSATVAIWEILGVRAADGAAETSVVPRRQS